MVTVESGFTTIDRIAGGAGGVPKIAKLAVSVTGPSIVTEAEPFDPEYEPLPLPAQPLNAQPSEAVALMPTTALLLFQPLAGLALPPNSAFMVR